MVQKDHKFVSYLIVLLALFLLFFFTKDQYDILQVNLDRHSDTLLSLEAGKQKLDDLNRLKDELTNDTLLYEKYLVEVKEDEVIDYIYSYVEGINSEKGIINIKSIRFSEGKKNELGFLESDVQLSLVVSDEDMLLRFLDFLVSPKSQYNFFIDNFSYPNDGRTGSFSVNVPLKIFYK